MESKKVERLSPYRWWVLTMVSLTAFFVTGMAWMCLPPLFHEISQEAGYGLNQLLFAWGMIPLAGFIANIPSGMLADRYGTRWVCGLGLLATGIFGASRALAGSFPSFLVVMFLFGGAVPLIAVNQPKVLGTWFPPKQLGLASGIMMASWGAGSALAVLLSGTLLSPTLGGWRNVVYLSGGVNALLGIIWIVTMKDGPADTVPKPEERRFRIFASLSSLIRKRQVLILCIVNLLMLGGWLGYSGSVPFLLEKVRSWPAASAHGIVSFGLWMFVIGSLVVPVISDRIGLRRPVLSLSMLACAGFSLIFLLLAAKIPPHPVMWVLAGTGTLCAGGMPVIFVVPLESSEIGVKGAGTTMGLINTAGCLGGFLFPFLNGWISGPNPNQSTIIYIAILCYVIGYGGAGALVWLLEETGPRRTRPAKFADR